MSTPPSRSPEVPREGGALYVKIIPAVLAASPQVKGSPVMLARLLIPAVLFAAFVAATLWLKRH